ncbi:hypothetical protein [Neolewinella litorea]|uniref:Uncharacterized protein n=1 Tax=Neolewinella litorea TaxID=2562452 RepID=A0A4S4NJS1_9BACT|nr:hypothetical protein [Neolewinella litorea]THH40042.1 hypothetical protein E4021_10595 [Neolewinella litorea]
MANFKTFNGNDYSSSESDYENDPYGGYEGWEEESGDYDEYGESRRQRRGGSNLYRAVHRLQRQIAALRRHLQLISRRAGTPANLARRIQELERTTSGMQQSQFMAQLLDLPQLETIRFAGQDESQIVENSSFDKQSLLLLQLLGQGQGSTATGSARGGQQLECLLPLLLLQKNDDQEGDDRLSTLLLLTLLNKQG